MDTSPAVYDISGVVYWFCVSRVYTLLCVKRPLSGLHSNIRSQWRVTVFELSQVFCLNLKNIPKIYFLSSTSFCFSKEELRIDLF